MKKTLKILSIVKVYFSNKWIKWIIIPILLLILWLTLSLFYSSYKSFTVLQYNHNQDENDNFPIGKILKNQRIIGEFTGKENYLGIVSVRLDYTQRISFEEEDVLLFRIKEKGQEQWYYENKYRSGLMIGSLYFPFGFTKISDSYGKIYRFEIISLNGNDKNAITIKAKDPIFVSKYKFSKNEILLGGSQAVLSFSFKKVFTFFSNFDTLISSLIFLLPLIIYLIWLTAIYEFKIANKLFAAIVISLILADIIWIEEILSGLLFGLTGLWILAIYKNKFSSKISFLFSFTLIFLAVVLNYFNFFESINKISTFAYMLLIIGSLQMILEQFKLKGN